MLLCRQQADRIDPGNPTEWLVDNVGRYRHMIKVQNNAPRRGQLVLYKVNNAALTYDITIQFVLNYCK